MINRDSDPPGGRTSPQSDHHGSEGGHDQKNKKLFPFLFFTRSMCGDESGLRAGGRVPLASLGKVLVEPVTAIIIVYAY